MSIPYLKYTMRLFLILCTLSSVSVFAEPVQRFLLVGLSGAGKTTLVNTCISAERGEHPLFVVSVKDDEGDYPRQSQLFRDGIGIKPYGEAICQRQSGVRNAFSSDSNCVVGYRNGRSFELIDTPGLLDTDGAEVDEKALKAIEKFIYDAESEGKPIHGIIMVDNPHAKRQKSQDVVEAIKKIFSLFPNEQIKENVFFVVNRLAVEEEINTYVRFFREFFHGIPEDHFLAINPENSIALHAHEFEDEEDEDLAKQIYAIALQKSRILLDKLSQIRHPLNTKQYREYKQKVADMGTQFAERIRKKNQHKELKKQLEDCQHQESVHETAYNRHKNNIQKTERVPGAIQKKTVRQHSHDLETYEVNLCHKGTECTGKPVTVQKRSDQDKSVCTDEVGYTLMQRLGFKMESFPIPGRGHRLAGLRCRTCGQGVYGFGISDIYFKKPDNSFLFRDWTVGDAFCPNFIAKFLHDHRWRVVWNLTSSVPQYTYEEKWEEGPSKLKTYNDPEVEKKAEEAKVECEQARERTRAKQQDISSCTRQITACATKIKDLVKRLKNYPNYVDLEKRGPFVEHLMQQIFSAYPDLRHHEDSIKNDMSELIQF